MEIACHDNRRTVESISRHDREQHLASTRVWSSDWQWADDSLNKQHLSTRDEDGGELGRTNGLR